MKEYPILFSSEMVRAILEGRKTQTRRVMKPQPYFDVSVWRHPAIDDFWIDLESMALVLGESDAVQCPYGYAYADGTADRLWVRETFATHSFGNEWVRLRYIADGKTIEYKRYEKIPGGNRKFDANIPSIHMPRWASRITLEIVNVRVEQIQSISREDIDAEGTPPFPNQMSYRNDNFQRYKDFKYLWDSINSKRGFGWDANPWVWVVEFRRLL